MSTHSLRYYCAIFERSVFKQSLLPINPPTAGTQPSIIPPTADAQPSIIPPTARYPSPLLLPPLVILTFMSVPPCSAFLSLAPLFHPLLLS